MPPPLTPPPTGLSTVRQVAQVLRLLLDSPEHAGVQMALSRMTVDHLYRKLLAALVLLEQGQARPPRRTEDTPP